MVASNLTPKQEHHFRLSSWEPELGTLRNKIIIIINLSTFYLLQSSKHCFLLWYKKTTKNE